MRDQSSAATRRSAGQRIWVLWIVFCAGLFLLLVTQSFGGAYGNRSFYVWGWFLLSVLPSFSIVTTLYTLFEPGSNDTCIGTMFFYRLAFWSSVMYLIMVSAPLLIHPFLAHPLETFFESGVWNGIMQSVVVAAIATFYVTRYRSQSAGYRQGRDGAKSSGEQGHY